MIRPVNIFWRLVIGALFFLGTGSFFLTSASNGKTIMGGGIPLMDGASIVKESLLQGSGRVELEVGVSPEEVARFYNQAMEQKGWPSGRVMSAGNQSALMLNNQGDQLILKAESKNGRTRVIIALIRKTQSNAAPGPLPSKGTAVSKGVSPAPQSDTVPEDRGIIVEGAPPAKGSLVKRIIVPPHQGSGSPYYRKKDSGSLPEDPEPPPEEPEPDPDSDPEDPGTSKDSGAQAGNSPEDEQGMLSVSLRATIRWDAVNTESNEKYTEHSGYITLQLNGTMKPYAEGSPAIQKGDKVLVPVRSYKRNVMTGTYNYNELMESYKPRPKELCQDPMVHEYQGGGIFMIDIDSAMGLKIVRFGSTAAPYLKNLSADKQQFLASMQLSTMTPDYYEFYVGGPGTKKTIPGRKTDRSKKICSYESVEKTMEGFTFGIKMKLPESGIMSGSKTWSSDYQGGGIPPLGISVADITPLQEELSFRPTEGGNKKVTYTVSWIIQPAGASGDEFEPVEEKKKKKPCEILQQKIQQLNMIRELYDNPNIRKFADENYPDKDKLYDNLSERLDRYQGAIENLFTDLMEGTQLSDWNNPESFAREVDTLSDAQISDAFRSIDRGAGGGGTSTFMAAGAGVSKIDPCDFRDLGIRMNIHGGKSQKIVDFSRVEEARATGNPSFDNVEVLHTVYFEAARASYAADYFDYPPELGNALFKAALAHEMGHCRQYVEGCFPKSTSEMAQYEKETYKIEIDILMKYLGKWDC